MEALHHHWLDEVFEYPAEAPQRLLNHPKAVEAFRNAEAAFHEREQTLGECPSIAAGSPAQAARQAFLEALRRS